MSKLVDDDEKLVRTIFVLGQNNEMWFLTEDRLYEVLIQSRKSIAKSFKKDVIFGVDKIVLQQTF